MLEITHADTAIFLGDGDAVEAKLTHLGPEIAREKIGLINFLGAWRDLVYGKLFNGITQHVGLLAEIEI